MQKFKNTTGSSLVTAMIFAFVVLVTVSSLVYLIRYNLLSIKSLTSEESVMTTEQQYIQNATDKGSIKIGKTNLGSYSFENTLKSEQPIFSNIDSDVLLYHAQPAAISSDIVHKMLYKKDLKMTKNIIQKSLPENSMINYHSEFVPINVPYLDISRMNDSQRFYRLDQKGKIADSKVGFIGFIEKEYNWLLISIGDKTQVINLRDLELSSKYEVNIGWNLEKGHWNMIMSVYDKDHIYIFRTRLRDLVNNFDKAILDLSTPVDIIDPPSNIESLSWYYPKDNSEPSLAVLMTRRDGDDNLIVIIEDLNYDKYKNRYKSSIKDTINALGKVEDHAYVVALDPDYTLGKSVLYVFAGDRMIAYNLDNSDKFKKITMVLNGSIVNKPLVIKKDEYEYYILTYENDRYHQYVYTKNTDIINVSDPIIYPEEKIQDITVRYGLKFIVTKKNMYISDFNNNQLNKVTI